MLEASDALHKTLLNVVVDGGVADTRLVRLAGYFPKAVATTQSSHHQAEGCVCPSAQTADTGWRLRSTQQHEQLDLCRRLRGLCPGGQAWRECLEGRRWRGEFEVCEQPTGDCGSELQLRGCIELHTRSFRGSTLADTLARSSGSSPASFWSWTAATSKP